MSKPTIPHRASRTSLSTSSSPRGLMLGPEWDASGESRWCSLFSVRLLRARDRAAPGRMKPLDWVAVDGRGRVCLHAPPAFLAAGLLRAAIPGFLRNFGPSGGDGAPVAGPLPRA
jgi:hypothetical protein